MKTTEERAAENIHDDHVSSLQSLLQKNYDAEKSFKKTMEKAESPLLKDFLQKQAAQRSRFATEITDELRNLNEQPKESGTLGGDIHRGWIDVRTAFSGNKDEAVLAECIRGEKSSASEYEDQLKKHNFPPRIADVLRRQSNEIHQTLDEVKTLKDLAKNK